MNMDEAKFMAEMAKARASDKHGERSTAYWEGLERGLRRQYHGDKFGTAQEHALWLSGAHNGSEPSSRERGQGYRDGLAAKQQGHVRATILPMLYDDAIDIQFDVPAPDLAHRNYLATISQRVGNAASCRCRAGEHGILMKELGDAPAASRSVPPTTY
jgi:hypothetical protein